MFKGIIASGTSITAGSNIDITPKINSCNTSFNSDDSISILNPGYYNVFVTLPITNSSATSLTLQVYANGAAISEATSTSGITATTGITTFNISDCIKVARGTTGSVVKLSLVLTGGTATTAAAGNIIIQKVG